jgi:spermidine synthase
MRERETLDETSIPSFLMGSTLPALLRSLRPQDDGVAPATGVLYAANTAGALAETLATPSVLLPAFGIAGTGIFTGAVGLAGTTAALVLDRRVAALPPAVAREPAVRSRDPGVALALYAAVGGVALGYEVVWSELLVQFLRLCCKNCLKWTSDLTGHGQDQERQGQRHRQTVDKTRT